MTPKRRGRPRNAEARRTADADHVIVKSVYLLDGFGFPLNPKAEEDYPSGVFECVAVAARHHLGRGDAHGLALSANRIEQLYRAWKRAEHDRLFVRRDIDGSPFPPRAWSDFTVASRRERLPSALDAKPLADIADIIVQGRGECELPQRVDMCLERTNKTEAEMLQMPMPASLRRAYQWRPKPRPRGRPKKGVTT